MNCIFMYFENPTRGRLVTGQMQGVFHYAAEKNLKSKQCIRLLIKMFVRIGVRVSSVFLRLSSFIHDL